MSDRISTGVMSDRMHSDEFIYWTKATIGLQMTKEGLYKFIENEIGNLTESFQGDTDHFRRFLDKIVFNNRARKQYTRLGPTKNFTWNYPTNCKSRVCTNVFETIIEQHAKERAYNIKWNCHKLPSKMEPSMYWWVVAKFYNPDNDDKVQDSTGPKEVDPLALFTIMINCKVFENIWFHVQNMIEVRNKLVHSAANTISKEDMVDSFSKMKKLLGEEEVNKTSKPQLDEIKKLEKEQIFLTNIREDDHEMITKALELKEKALTYDMSVRRNNKQPTEHLGQLLQITSKAKIYENKLYKDQRDVEKQELVKKISDLQNDYIKLETKYKDEQQRWKHIENAYDILLKKTLPDLEKECERLKKRIAELEKEVAQNKKEYLDENVERTRLENELRIAEKDILYLRQEIEKLRQKYLEEQRRRTQLENKVDNNGLLKSVGTAATAGGAAGLFGGPVGTAAGAVGGAVAGAWSYLSRN